MGSKVTRVGLLGLGRAGSFHLQSLRLLENAYVEAVYDVDADKAKQVASHHACLAAKSADEIFDLPSIDAVIVATPTNAHYEFALKAIQAGVPVLTEKPLAQTLEQIDSCFEEAKKNSVPLFVAFQRRFDESFASLIQAVRNGEVGQLQYVRSVSRDNPVPSMEYIKISGGIYHDCMVHDLDMVAQIVGEKPTHMSSFASSFIRGIGSQDDFDNVVASLFFPSGVTAMVDVNRKSVYGYDQRLEAFGDGGMLQADNWHTTSVTRAAESGCTRPPVDFSFPTRYEQAYVSEVECFLKCVNGEMDVPITHDDVRTNHLLANGLELAAREKRVVAFDELE